MTPAVALTQQAMDFALLLDGLQAGGYAVDRQGEFFDFEPFEHELAEATWYWWDVDDVGPEFVFAGHFRWSTATRALGVSGCGLAFGMRAEESGYAIFLDDTTLVLLAFDTTGIERPAPVTGDKRFEFPNPGEADLAISVRGQDAFVFVDGDLVHFRLAETHDASGKIGLAIISATSQGYGTRCNIDGAKLWIPS